MDKQKELKRHFVDLMGELQTVIAGTEGDRRTLLRMTAVTLEGAYKALLIFDGDVTPAAALLPAEPPKSAKKPKAEKQRKYGTYGWVKLTAEEYVNLLEKLGQQEFDRCIKYVDESAQTTNNKNGWHDWNLTVQRCAREKWGIKPWGAPPPKEPTRADEDAAKFEADIMHRFMEGGA